MRSIEKGTHFFTFLCIEIPNESTGKLLELMRVLEGRGEKSIFKN